MKKLIPSAPPSRGILLVALGAPEYGNLAANLAASIRYTDAEVPIHLVHTSSSIDHLTPSHRGLFSSMSECPVECYTRVLWTTDHSPQSTVNGQLNADDTRQQSTDNSQPMIACQPSTATSQSTLEYIKAKTHIYELSPYQETLFLDVDMMIMPGVRISDTIAQLSAVCDYTIENRGFVDLRLKEERLDPKAGAWCDVRDVKRHYNTTGRFYNTHSEFIFFKKNKANQRFFDTVREVYDRRPVKFTIFDGTVPDEYAYNIATAITAHYPHRDDYIAIYWHGMDERKDWNKHILPHYTGFSLGGNYLPAWIASKVDVYKALAKHKLKLPYLFNVPAKKRWSKNRRTI